MAQFSEEAILELGISLKVEGRYDEAIAKFQEILETNAHSYDAHHQIGLVYGFTGMFDESLEELQKASGLAADRVDIRMDLALTYTMLGMYEEAKVEFEEVLTREPANNRARESLDFINQPL